MKECTMRPSHSSKMRAYMAGAEQVPQALATMAAPAVEPVISKVTVAANLSEQAFALRLPAALAV